VSPFLRHLLITVVLAGIAGFFGVWFGARRLASQGPPPLLPMVLNELTQHGLEGLTSEQKARLNDIATRYAHTRTALRRRVTGANFELADALAEEMSLGPKTQESINRLESTVGELQMQTVVYVLDLRNVLTPQQQTVFDAKVVEALMTDPR
jgi:Spy/CpxP family protein refolding chaperone